MVVRPSAKAVVNASEITYCAGLELDMNNVPGNTISGKKLPLLIAELSELASEIALNGDVD